MERAEQRNEKLAELAELRDRVARLEAQVHEPPPHWQARDFYTAYYATSGFFLGIFGAATSLLLNVVGSVFVEQQPLRIIQVYLTFPLGEKALRGDFDSGLALTIGCCLYIGTGMLLGIPFQLFFARFAHDSLVKRLIWATVLGLAVWLINFYAILAWLQPLLFGGNWIVETVPPLVAAATHLVYAWTMAFVFPLGAYTPYRRQSERI